MSEKVEVKNIVASIDAWYEHYVEGVIEIDDAARKKLESLLFALDGRGGDRNMYDWMLAL